MIRFTEYPGARNALALSESIRQSARPMRLTVLDVSLAELATLLLSEEEEPAHSGEVLRLLPTDRPPNRSICENGVRPCPYVSCRYHLYLDVRGDGVLRINFPHIEPDEMLVSCALDMAEDGPRTLEQVAALMGMSKERARQLEASALGKLRVALGAHELDDLED